MRVLYAGKPPSQLNFEVRFNLYLIDAHARMVLTFRYAVYCYQLETIKEHYNFRLACLMLPLILEKSPHRRQQIGHMDKSMTD